MIIIQKREVQWHGSGIILHLEELFGGDSYVLCYWSYIITAKLYVCIRYMYIPSPLISLLSPPFSNIK